MKIKKLKGVIILIIAGILFLASGSVLFLASRAQNPKEMYDRGAVYKTESYKKEKTVAVKLLNISQATEADNGALIYFAQVENSNQVIGLEVNKNSQTQKIIDDWIQSDEKSTYIIGKIVKFDSETQAKLIKRNLESPVKINAQYFLSSVEYENDTMWMQISSGVMAVVGVVCLVMSIVNWRKNKQTYEQLLALYPELANANELDEQASFVGKKSRLVVYKKHLLVLSSGVKVIDLTQIKWLDIDIVPAYRTRLAELKVIDLSDKTSNINLGNYRKKKGIEYDALFAYLAEHFPNILLGEEQKPNAKASNGLFGLGNKKTISEFLAEKQNEQKNEQDTSNDEQVDEHIQDEQTQTVQQEASENNNETSENSNDDNAIE